MKKIGFLIIFLVISSIFHIFSLYFIHLKIDAKNTPVVYGWPNIISRDDLFTVAPQAGPVLPKAIFSLDGVRRDYFASKLPGSDNDRRFLEEEWPVFTVLHDALDEYLVDIAAQVRPQSFDLWDEVAGLTSKEPENVTYNVFVSDRGKILFIYPGTLTINSAANLKAQDHIRSASFFNNSNFFWTKMERIVK